MAAWHWLASEMDQNRAYCLVLHSLEARQQPACSSTDHFLVVDLAVDLAVDPVVGLAVELAAELAAELAVGPAADLAAELVLEHKLACRPKCNGSQGKCWRRRCRPS